MRQIFCILLLSGLVWAADKPADPKLPEVSELRILNSYEKALLARQQFDAAQKMMNDFTNNYLQTCATELKAGGFPEGTSCSPNVETGKVTTVAPPKPPDKTPDKKP